jgi:hypothetical protein
LYQARFEHARRAEQKCIRANAASVLLRSKSIWLATAHACAPSVTQRGIGAVDDTAVHRHGSILQCFLTECLQRINAYPATIVFFADPVVHLAPHL